MEICRLLIPIPVTDHDSMGRLVNLPTILDACLNIAPTLIHASPTMVSRVVNNLNIAGDDITLMSGRYRELFSKSEEEFNGVIRSDCYHFLMNLTRYMANHQMTNNFYRGVGVYGFLYEGVLSESLAPVAVYKVIGETEHEH